MSYEIGDRVIVNMRNLNPDLIPPSLSPEVRGTVIENPSPGIYHVRLDDSIERARAVAVAAGHHGADGSPSPNVC